MQVDNDVLPELAGYPQVMTSKEVSEVLRLSPQSTARLLRSGGLPGFRVGGEWRCRRSDIQALMTREWTAPADTDSTEDEPRTSG